MRIPKWPFVVFIAGALLVTGFPAMEQGQAADVWAIDPDNPDNIDWKTGGQLERLAKYIGTLNYEAVWDDPYVHEHLLALMGADALAHLKENLQSRGTVDLEGSELVLEGGKPHETDVESGYLAVDLYRGEIYAGIYSNGHTTIYTRENGYTGFPRSLKIFAYWDKIYPIMMYHPKENITWVP